MKSNTIVKKFGSYRFMVDKGESQHPVHVFHGDNEVMTATLICCSKHVEASLVQFAQKYLKVAIARCRKDRKAIKVILKSTKDALKEAKL